MANPQSVTIAQCLTVCPPCGPAHDSSVREWMYLTVCPPCGPSHDSSVGNWMYLTVCFFLWPGFNSQPWRSISRHFSLAGWSRSANLSRASVAENGSISPQCRRITCRQRGGRPKFNHGETDRRWLKKTSQCFFFFRFNQYSSEQFSKKTNYINFPETLNIQPCEGSKSPAKQYELCGVIVSVTH